MFNILFKLFYTFFYIGLFTFGGGYAMIPLIQHDIIRNGWVANQNVLADFIGISESTPGPFAINISTFIGYEQAGIWGALAASIGVVLPSLIVILIIAMAFSKFATNKYVVGFLKGVRPTIVGIILAVGLGFIFHYVFSFQIADLKFVDFTWPALWKAFAIFVIIFSISKIWDRMNPIFLIIISAILGYIVYGFDMTVLTNFELTILHWFQNIRTTLTNYFFTGVTILGEEMVQIVILGVVYWCINKKVGERLALTLFVSLAVNNLVKVAVHRPRPFTTDSSLTPLRPETATGYSFPSGHTQSSSTLFFGLFYFLKKKWLLIVAIVISVLVAISRMYLGVHYFTDVLVGGILGLGFAYLGGRYLTDKLNYKKIYIYLLGVVIIAFIAILLFSALRAQDTVNGFDAVNYYLNNADVSKAMGAIVGFVAGILFEKSKVNFENHNNLKKNIIRFVFGIGIILVIRLLLKLVFGFIVDTDTLSLGDTFKSIIALLLDFIRYFSMVFIGIGIYPLLFKKLNI